MSKLNQREKSLHVRLKVLKSITYFCPFCDNENRLSRPQKQVRGGVVISSPPSGNAAKLIYCLKDGPEGEGRGGGGNSRKFYAGRLRPKVQPLTLIYILSKGRPRAGEELKKVFYGEAPPKGPAPYPYLYTV